MRKKTRHWNLKNPTPSVGVFWIFLTIELGKLWNFDLFLAHWLRLFRRLFVTCGVFTRYFFVAFPWLFRGPLLSRTVFGPFSWLLCGFFVAFFFGFFVALVLGKIYTYSPYKSLLSYGHICLLFLLFLSCRTGSATTGSTGSQSTRSPNMSPKLLNMYRSTGSYYILNSENNFFM